MWNAYIISQKPQRNRCREEFCHAPSGREQNETAGGNKMRLRFGALSVQAGLIRNPRYSWENTGSRAVCWRGQASGGNGLRAPARVATGRHRVTDSPRPRQQARPESSIRAPLNALTPSIPPPTPVSFCSHIKSHFELPPTLNILFRSTLIKHPFDISAKSCMMRNITR